MLKTQILILFFIGFTSGATVSPCGIPNMGQDMKCFMKFVDFLKNNFLLILKSTDKAQDFRNSCNSLQSCYTSLECRKTDPDVMELRRKVQVYCDSMMYMSTDFVDCGKKMDAKKSECWNGYFPAPDRFCSNVFGKDNCVKREIMETCGQNDWIGFRDNVLNLLSVGYQDCNFDNYRNL